MAFEGNLQCIPGAVAGEDLRTPVDQGDGVLRSAQYLFMRNDGADGSWVRGSQHDGGSAWVLQNEPLAGEEATIAYSGVSKVRVGAPTIAAGALVCVGHAGRAVNIHAPGDMIGGLALTGGVEGELISVLLFPAWLPAWGN